MKGPLSMIFNNDRWRLTPAKGAKEFQTKSLYSNQTFFSHSLNVAITAAVLFCEDNSSLVRTENQALPGSQYCLEDVVRVLLGAAAFHDFNKLVGDEYPGVLESRNDILTSLLNEYLRNKELLSDIKYLILTTEGGTSGHAVNLKTELPGHVLAKLQTYIEAGDRLSGYHGYANAKSYSDQLSVLKNNSTALGKIKLITFVPRLQLLIVWKLRQAIMQYLPTQHNKILHEGSDFISYIGEDLTEEDYKKLDEKLQLMVGDDPSNSMEIINQYPPTHNSIKWAWAERVEPSYENMLEFIYRWGGRLILWEGSWFTENAGLLVSSKVPFKIIDGRPRIDSPDDLKGTIEATRNPIVSTVACSLAIDRGLSPGKEAEIFIKDLNWPLDKLVGIPRKTAIALAWSAWVLSDSLKTSERIDEIINELSAELKDNIKRQENPLIGFTSATILSDSGMIRTDKTVEKKLICYQCQGEGKYPLEATRVHGYGAQNSTGLKLTKLSDNAKGSLCPWCVAENQLRNREFEKEKGSLAVHVHMADLMPDVAREDIEHLMPKATEEGQIGVNEIMGEIRFFPRGRFVKLDGHMTIILEVPRSEKVEEGRFLRDLYNVVYQTGMKIHATSFMSNALPPIPMLSWDNAPAWAKNLNLDRANIDDVLRKRNILESLFKMGQAQGGSDGFGNFVISFNRHPQHLYFVANRCYYDQGTKGLGVYLESEEGRKRISLLEEEYMNAEQTNMMQKLGILGVEIAPSPKWSANDHRWVMQEAIKALESSRSLPHDERAHFVAAQIAAYAQRFQIHSSTTAIDEKASEFTMLLMDYLNKYHKGEVPTGIMRSYLINHYSYEYRRNYRMVRPKEDGKGEVEQ